ncbi:MAG: glutamine amidotransferase-related protein, partial [Pyrobaculum sp.]
MEKILVVNFGGQYAHLIARRVRDAGVYAEITTPENAVEKAKEVDVKAVILSGGPSSVYDSPSPDVPMEIFELGKPVLGICYGHQLIAKKMGGRVARGKGEYGRTLVKVVARDPLLEGWGDEEIV